MALLFNCMRIVITDLDGTLLDQASYSFQPARPALEELKRRGVPLIFCTSKTRAETERWQNVLDTRHPTIVENGGLICIPDAYFGAETASKIAFGAHYADLTAALREASRVSCCRVRGFADMSVAEVAAECGLSLADAALAKKREHDEPFLILDPQRSEDLFQAIHGLGYRCTRGGRFFHIIGDNDKAHAVRRLVSLFALEYGQINSLGLGDGLNDAEFLNAVDHAVLIRSAQLSDLQKLVPNGVATRSEGPEGWNEAVLDWLQMVI